MSEKQRLRRAETVRALERMGAHAENYCIHLDDHQQSDWVAGIESVEFFIEGMESELARLRGVVEALAKADPWRLTACDYHNDHYPNADECSGCSHFCKHCGGIKPGPMFPELDAHRDGCTWLAAVVALEGETP